MKSIIVTEEKIVDVVKTIVLTNSIFTKQSGWTVEDKGLEIVAWPPNSNKVVYFTPAFDCIEVWNTTTDENHIYYYDE